MLLTLCIPLWSGCAKRIEPTTRPARIDRPLVTPVPNVEVNLLAMGDWGTGHDNQRRVTRVLSKYVREFAADKRRKSAKFFRILNEVPTVLLIFIVILAVVKPF